MSQRFATRTAWASFFFAFAAAVSTALITGGLGWWLLGQAEDTRLRDAAVVFAAEFKSPGLSTAELEEMVREEVSETNHMGTAFAVFDQAGQRLAGDHRLRALASGDCAAMAAEVRACSVQNESYVVVAGAPHAVTGWWLLAAALASCLIVAGVAFVASRPLAASVVAPLSQLEQRVAQLDASTITKGPLAPDSGVTEVESLRRSIESLLHRVDSALGQATRFASDAAHELRTPLSTIEAELELMLAGDGSAASIGRVRATASRLSLLVERLLVLATPSTAGALTEPVSMRDAVEDTVAALPSDDRARVSVEISGDFTVRGDATLMAMLISNAISNGLKFGRRVTVSVAPQELRFDDDGPGVPVAERTRVFEALYRGVNARSARVPGHGLGLALIAHIAKAHGGTARFEDVPGGRLTVHFPVNPQSG